MHLLLFAVVGEVRALLVWAGEETSPLRLVLDGGGC